LALDFARLVWAALIGYVAFAEIPGVGTWLGGILSLAAVTYIAYRERDAEAVKTML
jgi:drug/metabolite transporter (DMT)-like permease